MNQVLQEDFEYLYLQQLPWEELNGSCVLVTGGTGLIGSLLIKFMDFLNCKKGGNIQIYTIVRNFQNAEMVLKGIPVHIIGADISNGEFSGAQYHLPEKIDYVFHCAAITKSKEMIQHPVEVYESIVEGTSRILKLARMKSVRSMVYLSSMESYGQPDTAYEMVTEEVSGYINPLTERSCYSMGKRMAENLCYDYFSEYQIPVKIARLAQTFGAGVLPTESRIFAQFAHSIQQGKDIVLHTDGSSIGNYCYTSDAMFGLFLLLFCGQDGDAYNIANEEASMSIRQMAELAAEQIGMGKIKVVYDIPEGNCYGYAPPVKMKLCSDKIRSLGWKAKYGMADMYQRMMRYEKHEKICEE